MSLAGDYGALADPSGLERQLYFFLWLLKHEAGPLPSSSSISSLGFPAFLPSACGKLQLLIRTSLMVVGISH